MSKEPMKRDEILRQAAERSEPDEREEQLDLLSTDDAYLGGQIICSILALIKIAVFHKRPYDIFAVQFGAETLYLYKKWKKMRESRFAVIMIFDILLFILSFGCFIKDETDQEKKA